MVHKLARERSGQIITTFPAGWSLKLLFSKGPIPPKSPKDSGLGITIICPERFESSAEFLRMIL